ncbi:MAG: hypothetical protein ACE5LC_04160 [Candidatus Aminicenantales bacterium]
MSEQRPTMMTPALVGGVVAGLLSGIPLLNCLCCLWIIGGAVLASYLLIKDSPVKLTGGDGAIVGVFTGIVAAVVDALISLPLQPLNKEFALKIMDWVSEYGQEIPPGLDSLIDKSLGKITFFSFMFDLVVSAVVFAILGALGGIIGISLFQKKTPPPYPGESSGGEISGQGRT